MPLAALSRRFRIKTRVLYYALVLPGMGKDSPPLPVTELLTNSHSAPPISHWLLEFKRNISMKTKRNIARVETHHSWALMNSTVLAFNRENMSAYLDRAFKIAPGQMEDIPKFTVLHLCSAHILKAVQHWRGEQMTKPSRNMHFTSLLTL